MDGCVDVNVVHLCSAICIASEVLSVNHLYSVPSQGRLRQCRLGFEHDTDGWMDGWVDGYMDGWTD